MKSETLKGHLDILVLRVLEDGPSHGYRVIELLRERSAGTFDLPEGTVYPVLHRLERRGLLSSAWTTGAGRRRRVYSLTGPGRLALTAGRQDWARFTVAVGSVLKEAT